MEQPLFKNDPCPHCGRYDNRAVHVDAVVVKDGKILLIKRGAEPFRGIWALPGGSVEWDESVEDAVIRETFEETGLTVANPRLIGAYSRPERHPTQAITLAYLVQYVDGEPVAGDDADEIKWSSFETPPLAFDHSSIIADVKKYL